MTTQIPEAQIRDNLRRLSAYLKTTFAKSQGVSFDMNTFCKVTPSHLIETNECGTIACSIGHYAVMMGWEVASQGARPKDCILPKGEGVSPSGYMFWWSFSEKIIGVKKDNYEGLVLWRWLFATDWSSVDNTALGAAARIDYYLENGVPKQFSGGNTVSYTIEVVELYESYRLPHLIAPQFDSVWRGDVPTT